MDIFLIGGGQKVERKWGFILCGLVMYNILIGCGENVGFLPTNCPHFLGPAKVKQHPSSIIILTCDMNPTEVKVAFLKDVQK